MTHIEKEKMRQAMRYAVPRMMWYHPVAAIRHLIRELPEQREQSEARFNYAESRQKKAEGQLK